MAELDAYINGWRQRWRHQQRADASRCLQISIPENGMVNPIATSLVTILNDPAEPMR
jgi:hypothetical protein